MPAVFSKRCESVAIVKRECTNHKLPGKERKLFIPEWIPILS